MIKVNKTLCILISIVIGAWALGLGLGQLLSQQYAQIQAVFGTAALPAITFAGDPNTGIYRPAADQIGLSAGGVQRLNINAVGIDGALPFSAPAAVVGAPSYSFTGDPNTGIYSPAADQIALATVGVQRANVHAAGVDATVAFRGPNGAIGAPTFSFTGDPDTGMYSAGGGIIGFSSNGALQVDIDANRIYLQAPLAIQFVGVAFAALGAPANGTLIYCSDCTIASPCAAAGTGSIAKRLNGVWVCN